MRMDPELLQGAGVGLSEEEEADMNDWKLPLAFMKKRHGEKIEGSKALAQSWRMKDRVRTALPGVPAPPGPRPRTPPAQDPPGPQASKVLVPVGPIQRNRSGSRGSCCCF